MWHHTGHEGISCSWLGAWGLQPLLCPGTPRDFAATVTAVDVLFLCQ